MTIETKYNIGDEVWISNSFREAFRVTVYGIVVEVTDGNIMTDYKVGYTVDSCVLRKEELIFLTKEELLKSL